MPDGCGTQTVELVREWTYRGWTFRTVKAEGRTIWRVTATTGTRLILRTNRSGKYPQSYTEGRVEDIVDAIEDANGE